MQKLILFVLVVSFGVVHSTVGQCSPEGLKKVVGSQPVNPPAEYTRGLANEIHEGDQAALVCQCMEQDMGLSTQNNPCDLCQWTQGSLIGTNTAPGDVLATFDNFISCAAGTAAGSASARFGGSTMVFLRWDTWAPYCYVTCGQNFDDMPWDGSINGPEKGPHGGIWCTADHYTVEMPNIKATRKTYPTPSDADVEFWLGLGRDETAMDQVNMLRKLHAHKPGRGASQNNTGFYVAIFGGAACVVAALVAVFIVHKRSQQPSADYNTMQELEEM